MKKFGVLLLAFALALSCLAGCGGNNETPSTGKTDPAPADNSSQGNTNTQEPAATSAAPSGRLVIYTASATGHYEAAVEQFNNLYPDIEVEVVSAGSGELASRITAEGENAQGDVMWGGSYATYANIADYLMEYVTPESENFYPEYVSSDARFTAVQINVNTIIVNNGLLSSLGAEVTGWESLTDPVLKGNIAYADPSSASSALEQLVNMLTSMSPTDNPDDGWDFVESFMRNLDGKVASSSSAIFNGVVSGEYAVGITNEEKVLENMFAGADVSPVYAKEGITLRNSYCALIKNCANEENAKLFIDFLASYDFQNWCAENLYMRSVRKDVSFKIDGVVSTGDLPSTPYPIEWADGNSSNLKTTWQDKLTSLS